MQDVVHSNEVQLNKKNPISHKLLPILIFLTIVQQMPIVRDNYYSRIRIVLYLVFGLLSFISILNLPGLLKYKPLNYHFICIIYAVLMFLVSKLLGLEIDTGIISELLIPFGILLCSLNIKYSKEYLERILNKYILLSAILGISLIFYYGSGFVISNSYFLVGKNAIGPLLGTSCIILVYRLLFIQDITENRRSRKKSNLSNLILFVVLASSIVVLRNRSGLVALMIVILLMLLKRLRLKVTLKSIITFQLLVLVLIILTLIGSFDRLIEIIWSSFTMNYDVYDINSISAGRSSVYLDSLNYSIRYPLFGELSTVSKFYATPHNYILNKWVRYGIMGSFPLIIFYLSLWKSVLAEVIGNKKGSKRGTVALWVLLFSLIVSIFEYTYPFGPGVSQIMVWFLLGQYLNKSK